MYRTPEPTVPSPPEIRLGDRCGVEAGIGGRVRSLLAASGAEIVTLAGYDSLRVRLGRRLQPESVTLDSRTNDNQRFLLRVRLPRLRKASSAYVGFEDRWCEGGVGTSEAGSEAIFELDRASALGMARAWSVEARERSALDTRLRYSWSFPAEVSAARGPALVTLRIENGGDAALCLEHVGSYSFTFEATRDGVPVRLLGPFMYSGPTQLATIPAGGSIETRADLGPWMAPGEPGLLEITARFDATLVASGLDSMASRMTAAVWDIQPAGLGAVRLR